MPNTPVEVRRGVIVVAEESPPDDAVRELLERVGVVVTLPERLMDVAGATSGVSPAYVAVIAEAMVDAAVKQRAHRAGRLAARGRDASPAPPSCWPLAAATRSPCAARWPPRAARRPAALQPWSVGRLRAAFLEAMEAVMRP